MFFIYIFLFVIFQLGQSSIVSDICQFHFVIRQEIGCGNHIQDIDGKGEEGCTWVISSIVIVALNARRDTET